MHSPAYSLSVVKKVISAKGIIVTDELIDTLFTDSRQITRAANGLFFALSSHRDGHQFIRDAYAAGVRSFVVQHIPLEPPADANFLVVTNVLVALQQLAAYHRSQVKLPVIGITGSNGKTIVKEWLYQLLSTDYHVVRNPKSYNSQIGVPLSVWQTGDNNDLGIFEAGISTVREMEKLEAIIQPTIGILTHIGAAHDEGFAGVSEKIEEKIKLFKNCGLVIYQYDTLLDYQSHLPSGRHFTWSRKYQEADLKIVQEVSQGRQVQLQAVYQQTEISCTVPFNDEASIENAITCWATLLAMGYAPWDVQKRLTALNPVSMRLELKNGRNNCSVIDDSYNSDIQSLEIALNFLNQQNQHSVKTLILSDILQSGLSDDDLYRQVADLVSQKKVNKFIGVGDSLMRYRHRFNTSESYFYADTSALLQALPQLTLQNETILIKGARRFEFERVSQALEQKAHETVLEINLNALVNNLNFYRSQLQPRVKLMAMVKAFSYGSGTFEVANVLQYQKVDYLAVAYVDEGISLRQAGITLPIMVLNPEPSAFSQLLAYHLEPEIYSLSLLQELISHTQPSAGLQPIHIKVDTGMHRLGFHLNELDELCAVLLQHPELRVQSVFSHLVASDAAKHDDFTRQQICRFTEACERIQAAIQYPFIKHIVNTSGITRWPQAQFDMVRLGIGLYGVDSAIPKHSGGLQPVATLKTSISQIMRLQAGETVGYNRSGKLEHDGKIATVRIGYADGYLRAFGNGVGHMLVNGQPAPTVGNIAMDMCMIDITGIDAHEGDEVIVFNDRQTIEDLAQQIGTISYEILTTISQRVKRVYFYE